MRILAVAIAMLAAPAVAQDLPDLTTTVTELDGVEVQSSGQIGYVSLGEAPLFQSDSGRFDTRLAVDRETLRRLDDCSLQLGGDACQVDISAEIEVDGAILKLIVFDIRNLRQE